MTLNFMDVFPMVTRPTISKVTVTNNDNLGTIRACPSLCSAGLFSRQIMFSVYLCDCRSQTDTPTRLFLPFYSPDPSLWIRTVTPAEQAAWDEVNKGGWDNESPQKALDTRLSSGCKRPWSGHTTDVLSEDHYFVPQSAHKMQKLEKEACKHLLDHSWFVFV